MGFAWIGTEIEFMISQGMRAAGGPQGIRLAPPARRRESSGRTPRAPSADRPVGPKPGDPGGDASRFDGRFAALVVPMIGELHRVSRRIVGSDDLAWDAVQEALLGLWTHGSPPPNPRAWLIRAVLHRSLNQARRDRRRRAREAKASLARPEADPLADPSRALLAAEWRAEVDRAFARLSEGQRLVLRLSLFDGLSYDAIAGRLGVPLGTVRSRLNRSREALRKILDGGERAKGGDHGTREERT